MSKGGKAPKEVPEFRRLLAENLVHLMRTAANVDLRSTKGLAKEAGVNRKTIDRMLRPQTHPQAPNLDSVVAVFSALGREPWEILLPQRRPRVIEQDQAAANNGSDMRNAGRKDKRFKGS